jgi:aspartate kinase
MRSHAGVAATAFRALAAKGINIKAITTSEIKISILIDGPYAELAVRTLHSVYGLDKKLKTRIRESCSSCCGPRDA